MLITIHHTGILFGFCQQNSERSSNIVCIAIGLEGAGVLDANATGRGGFAVAGFRFCPDLLPDPCYEAAFGNKKSES